MTVDEASPPPSSSRSKRAPRADSRNARFGRWRIASSADTQRGVVEGGEDQELDAEEDRRVLPAAGLPVDREAGHRAPHDAALADRVGGRGHRLPVAERHRRDRFEDVDVPLLLEQPLSHPRRPSVVLEDHASALPRR